MVAEAAGGGGGGLPGRAGIAKLSTHDAVQLRCEWRRAADSLKYASRGWAWPVPVTPLCHLRANRDAPSPAAPPRAGALGAGGARAAWRWKPGGAARTPGLGRVHGRLAAGCRGRGAGNPWTRRDPSSGLGRPGRLGAAGSPASGAPWRHAPRLWAPDFRRPPPHGAGGAFARRVPRRERGIDQGQHTVRGRREAMDPSTWLLTVCHATAPFFFFLQSKRASARKTHILTVCPLTNQAPLPALGGIQP